MGWIGHYSTKHTNPKLTKWTERTHSTKARITCQLQPEGEANPRPGGSPRNCALYYSDERAVPRRRHMPTPVLQ
ncbi:hypothetical protein BDA96_06G240400 [Sorghum bicolor]|uniref:Uncharacterized protein n=2 Tax=Sorghum bicolor TaxID=4558 RepID=A0A921QTP7_SORBI|nr:hypothetical protein BDA96_06G240400 [Sorghum bicolor]KXG27137.1 hypothetical protein SORBI_3006G219400 [Sorghum bicolor]